MIQVRLSADSFNELQRAIKYISCVYHVHNIKEPKKREHGRYKAYIFVTEKPGKSDN